MVKNLDQPELVPLSAAIDVENVARIVGNVDNDELPAGASFPVLPMSEKMPLFVTTYFHVRSQMARLEFFSIYFGHAQALFQSHSVQSNSQHLVLKMENNIRRELNPKSSCSTSNHSNH